jgi:hypothetical protein
MGISGCSNREGTRTPVMNRSAMNDMLALQREFGHVTHSKFLQIQNKVQTVKTNDSLLRPNWSKFCNSSKHRYGSR